MPSSVGPGEHASIERVSTCRDRVAVRVPRSHVSQSQTGVGRPDRSARPPAPRRRGRRRPQRQLDDRGVAGELDERGQFVRVRRARGGAGRRTRRSGRRAGPASSSSKDVIVEFGRQRMDQVDHDATEREAAGAQRIDEVLGLADRLGPRARDDDERRIGSIAAASTPRPPDVAGRARCWRANGRTPSCPRRSAVRRDGAPPTGTSTRPRSSPWRTSADRSSARGRPGWLRKPISRSGASSRSMAWRDGGVSTITRSHSPLTCSSWSRSIAMYSCAPDSEPEIAR